MNASAVGYAFNWGDSMQTYLTTQDTLSSVGTAYFEVACFGSGDPSEKNGFVAESLIYIMLPILFVSLAYLGTVLSVYLTSKEAQGAGDSVFKSAQTAAMGIATILLFLLQPSLVKQFALFFSCTRLGKDSGDMFLTEDLTIQCYSREHWLLVASLGLPLLLCYVIGIPLAIYLILSHPSNRPLIEDITRADQVGHAAQLDDPASIRAAAEAHGALSGLSRSFETSYAFLFLGYKPEHYLWELVVLARKGGLSIIAVAFSSDPDVQVMLGLLLIFFSTVAHARFQPFDDDLMNNYEFMSLFVSSMTFFLGVFTMSGSDSPDSLGHAVVSGLAFAINMGYVLVAIPVGFKVRKKAKYLKKVHKEVVAGEERAHKEKENEGDLLTTVEDMSATETLRNDLQDMSMTKESIELTDLKPSVAARDDESQAVGKDLARPTQDAVTGDRITGVRRVRAKSKFVAKSPKHMSFAKGDLIRVVADSGKWHKGELVASQTYPTNTGQILFYPSNFVTADVPEDEKVTDTVTALSKVTNKSLRVLAVAITRYEANKPNRMSFEKGYTIQVVDTKGSWHRGKLVKSSKYPITNEILFYPSNFVQARRTSKAGPSALRRSSVRHTRLDSGVRRVEFNRRMSTLN